jgi:hypothetical protein
MGRGHSSQLWMQINVGWSCIYKEFFNFYFEFFIQTTEPLSKILEHENLWQGLCWNLEHGSSQK